MKLEAEEPDPVKRLHQLGLHDLAEQKRKQLERHSDDDGLRYLRRVVQRTEPRSLAEYERSTHDRDTTHHSRSADTLAGS